MPERCKCQGVPGCVFSCIFVSLGSRNLFFFILYVTYLVYFFDFFDFPLEKIHIILSSDYLANR